MPGRHVDMRGAVPDLVEQTARAGAAGRYRVSCPVPTGGRGVLQVSVPGVRVRASRRVGRVGRTVSISVISSTLRAGAEG
ncbi:hypothetical protein Kpho02_69200 [Kitasatospora phosalacinea]|uniref:Uncharacterized protein n=1 Tax=Kitasatospora phosalacinea TaxID=2065 RepID=A0A9W6QHL4_9ACTN|nr:hypothetical protein Kpho02_69200 [Kitasatospora phosalacinea]